MAKAKKVRDDVDESLIEATDIVSLLSEPGFAEIYDREITQIECREGFELPSIDLSESLPAVLCASSEEPKVDRCKIRLWSDFKPIEGDTLEKVIADIAKCESCDLCKTRNKTVPGAGSSYAKLMLIGEGPGADEDATGIPFVGKAGQHLDKILAAAGFKRDEVYICNVVKCRPPNNRDPKMEEMAVCSQFLQRQIHLIKPCLIACLGNIAVKYVIGPKAPGIMRIHGQWFDSVFGIKTMPMYHPSYLLRDNSREKGSPNWEMWQDIKALKQKYDSI